MFRRLLIGTAVVFTTEAPQGCTTDSGLSSVDVHGAVAVGSTS